jgi:hypothetical protein
MMLPLPGGLELSRLWLWRLQQESSISEMELNIQSALQKSLALCEGFDLAAAIPLFATGLGVYSLTIRCV